MPRQISPHSRNRYIQIPQTGETFQSSAVFSFLCSGPLKNRDPLMAVRTGAVRIGDRYYLIVLKFPYNPADFACADKSPVSRRPVSVACTEAGVFLRLCVVVIQIKQSHLCSSCQFVIYNLNSLYHLCLSRCKQSIRFNAPISNKSCSSDEYDDHMLQDFISVAKQVSVPISGV